MNLSYLTVPNFLSGVLCHGFSTRRGGLSQGSFSSLNLGTAVGDDPGHVLDNHQLLRAAAGLPHQPIATVHQVHGDGVVVIGGGEASLPEGCIRVDLPREGLTVQVGTGDALITAERGILLGIRVADCVPILVASHDGSVIAAVHAGWRGTTLGILPRVLGLFSRHFDQAPQRLWVAIGPCIAAAHYEVGPEVANAVSHRLGQVPPGVIRAGQGDRSYVDLAQANVELARQVGVPSSQILCPGWDSFGQPELFFSHRRDQGHTGRMMAFISRGG